MECCKKWQKSWKSHGITWNLYTLCDFYHHAWFLILKFYVQTVLLGHGFSQFGFKKVMELYCPLGAGTLQECSPYLTFSVTPSGWSGIEQFVFTFISQDKSSIKRLLFLYQTHASVSSSSHAMGYIIWDPYTPVKCLSEVFNRGSMIVKWIGMVSNSIWNTQPLCATLWFSLTQRAYIF